jgi:transcriptional regulator GlxA family with amidase domain
MSVRQQPPPSPQLLAHLRRSKDLMDQAYGEPLDLAAMAREAGCSRFHFLRSFQAAYGETPGRYLTRRRVERAAELLRSVNLTVTEVCVFVGFSSLGSFSTRFKEIMGVPPSVYREQAVRDGGPPAIPGCFVLMWTRPHPATDDRPGDPAIPEKP